MSGGEALDRAGRRPIAADPRRRATVRGVPNGSTRLIPRPDRRVQGRLFSGDGASRC